MPVMPEEITPAGIRRRWRGYDRQQVTTLLERVAADYAGAIERLGAEAEQRAHAQAAHRDIQARLSALTDTARRDAEQTRRDADADSAAIRARAERAAALITGQAEDTATACLRQAEALRAAAQRDSDEARARLESADQRAHHLEQAARDRWEALRADIETGFDHLRLAERRFAQRVRRAETALSGLRSHVALLDQIHHAEEILAAIRADTQPHQDPRDTTHPADASGPAPHRASAADPTPPHPPGDTHDDGRDERSDDHPDHPHGDHAGDHGHGHRDHAAPPT
jgi:cell division septum initiation protein DivIVA